MNILLLEDELELQELFVLNLQDLGHTVRATDNISNGLEIYFSDFQPEIIISDIQLKGLARGTELISLLAQKTLVTPDVIFMTGGAMITEEQSQLLGARKLFMKPFKFFEMAIEIQKVVLLKKTTEKLIRELKQLSQCQSIGIRLPKGRDFPYYKYEGFADSFIMREKSLLGTNECGKQFLECMCGNVIEGRFDPKLPFFTPWGSFICNGTTDLIATTSPEERQTNTRNYCNKAGYESVALIPIKTTKNTFGLFQLNDFSKGKFTTEMIADCEAMAAKFAFRLLQTF